MSGSTGVTGKASVTSSFPSLLGLLFIGLKLAGIIAWPWVWVLAPFWIPLGLAVFVGIVCVVVMLVKGENHG